MSVQHSGKVNLRQIEKEPIDIELKIQDNKWLLKAFENAAPAQDWVGLDAKQWAQNVQFEGQMRLESVKPEYMVSGSFEAKVPSACSMCLEPFEACREGEFRLFLKRKMRGEEIEPSDDPDYVIIDSDEISLADIITEQLVVLEPISETQHRQEDGTLSCEKKVVGDEDSDKKDSPFAALSKLKGLKNEA